MFDILYIYIQVLKIIFECKKTGSCVQNPIGPGGHDSGWPGKIREEATGKRKVLQYGASIFEEGAGSRQSQ